MLDAWGRVIARFLRPGGIFYLMESHPMLGALEESPPGKLSFLHPCFHRDAPTVWSAANGDYADVDYSPEHPSYEWDWTVADIVNALLKAGLQLKFLHEYETIFFRFLPSMTSEDGRWFQFPDYTGKLPLLLTLRARKL